jgi:cell division protein FtsB
MLTAHLRDTIVGCAFTHDSAGRPPHRLANLAFVSPNSKQTLQLPALAAVAKQRVFLWRRRVATIAVTALALVMGYGVVFGHNGLTAFAHKREESRSLAQQRQRLEAENERLREHVDHLQNDPSAIEYAAREGLHYTRQGEVIYTLPAGDPGAKKSPAIPAH